MNLNGSPILNGANWTKRDLQLLAGDLGVVVSPSQSKNGILDSILNTYFHIAFRPEQRALIDWPQFIFWYQRFGGVPTTDQQLLINGLMHSLGLLQESLSPQAPPMEPDDDSDNDTLTDEKVELTPWDSFPVQGDDRLKRRSQPSDLPAIMEKLKKVFIWICPRKRPAVQSTTDDTLTFLLYMTNFLNKIQGLLLDYIRTYNVPVGHLFIVAMVLFFMVYSQDSLDDDSDCREVHGDVWLRLADTTREVWNAYKYHVITWLFHRQEPPVAPTRRSRAPKRQRIK
jgi:hypothetical protein